jgi:hypothetical protein
MAGDATLRHARLTLCHFHFTRLTSTGIDGPPRLARKP